MAELESFQGAPPKVVEGDLWVTGKIYGTLQSGGAAASNGSSDSGVPIGSVHYFAASTPPANYLVCDGTALDTGEYASLFNVTQYTFGGSGGSFNLPDLRGEFIRGWDDGKGTDSGRVFGSAQEQEFEDHRHALFRGSTETGGARDSNGYATIDSSSLTSTTNPSAISLASYDGRYTVTWNTGNETRPRNVALLPCIRYR